MMGLAGHAGLVAVYEASVDPRLGFAFLAMERLVGRDLLDQIRRGGPLDVVEALAFAASAAGALAMFHAAGFVHGDVKPSNLFVHHPGAGQPPVVKLLDPTVGTTDGAGRTPTTVTSPLYVAPEYVERGALIPASDVYALGLSIYEMVTGSPPMARNAAKLTDVYENQRSFDPPPLATVAPQVPREVSEIVARMIAKAPDQRYPDARRAFAVLADCVSRIRRGPANVRPDAPALALEPAPPSATPRSRPAAPPVQYGQAAHVATVALKPNAAERFGPDGVNEAALLRLRRVDPRPPLGVDVLAAVQGPTRVLGLRYPLTNGKWTVGRAPTCDLCVPHDSLEPTECELRQTERGITVIPVWGQPFDLPRGGRLALGKVVLERFAAGAPLPPESVVQFGLPESVLAREKRLEKMIGRVRRTHRLFLSRSPSPSEAMRASDEDLRECVKEQRAMWLYGIDMHLANPEPEPSHLAEVLMLAHEDETQLLILDGAPLADILETRLIPVIDWLAIARERIAARRAASPTT